MLYFPLALSKTPNKLKNVIDFEKLFVVGALLTATANSFLVSHGNV
jgi:hypothetical protein